MIDVFVRKDAILRKIHLIKAPQTSKIKRHEQNARAGIDF